MAVITQVQHGYSTPNDVFVFPILKQSVTLFLKKGMSMYYVPGGLLLFGSICWKYLSHSHQSEFLQHKAILHVKIAILTNKNYDSNHWQKKGASHKLQTFEIIHKYGFQSLNFHLLLLSIVCSHILHKTKIVNLM